MTKTTPTGSFRMKRVKLSLGSILTSASDSPATPAM